MTKPRTWSRTAPVLDEAEVAAYLEANTDFFTRQPQVLQKVRLPDSRNGGVTISLIERQVEVLRERARHLESRLAELVEVGRGNDVLAERIHRLARRLIATRTLENSIEAIESSLREDFDCHQAVLVLFRNDAALAALDTRFLRLSQRDAAEARSFDSLFAGGKPRCGQVRDSQRDFLFGTGAVGIGSVALVPLGPNGSIGLLACGSNDAHRFNPSMSTDYLARIGDMVGVALAAG
jgi:uncharacterized protein YigA (DUF484 family)